MKPKYQVWHSHISSNSEVFKFAGSFDSIEEARRSLKGKPGEIIDYKTGEVIEFIAPLKPYLKNW